MRSIAALLLFCVLISGCAGTNFSYDQARRVQVGMTESEVVRIMGSPYSVTSRGNEQMWVWSHANGFGAARAVSFKFADGRVVEVPSIPESFK
ncbi:outer membrane protein assembly factor BamE domain-containing protein [Stutzerimonas nitrititolerans]